MRLIDADALYDKAETRYKNSPTPYRKIYKGFVDDVSEAPTIDVASIVQWDKLKNTEEIRHFFEKEIEIAEFRLEKDPENPIYNGVYVGRIRSKKLVENHILFCKIVLRMMGDNV